MASSSTIPLHCDICPKKPDFTDISHLLTHVASKGHLSHYFKTKVRSTTDQDAKKLVDAYDTWYMQWDLESLMSERMRLKDKKQRRHTASAALDTPLERSGSPSTKSRRPPKGKRANAQHLDPMLTAAEGYLNHDTLMSHGQVTAAELQKLAHSLLDFTSAPKLHLWDTSRPASWFALPLESSNAPVEMLLQQPVQPAEEFVRSQPNVACFDDEATRLKGTIWPGMDLFDSASPETRRMRNQKKDLAVLKQLEQSASRIDPTETIYFPSGGLKKQRTITGDIDPDSSPWASSEPSPKALSKAHARIPLGIKAINTSNYRLISKSDQSGSARAKRHHSDGQTSMSQPKTRQRKREFKIFTDEADTAKYSDPEKSKRDTSKSTAFDVATNTLTPTSRRLWEAAPLVRSLSYDMAFLQLPNSGNFQNRPMIGNNDQSWLFQPSSPLTLYRQPPSPNQNGQIKETGDAHVTTTIDPRHI